MINVADIKNLEMLIEKIDIGVIIKISLGIVFYFIFLFVSKKLIELFFNKIVSKIHDTEIKRQYNTIQVLCNSIANIILILFKHTGRSWR